ncbi:carbamoyltransferase C-terminal domain-containing protein [Plantactinospora sp. KLBMP9567]|uniref:carbamoyltransferase C-terminal domain-containing protein n=1 Tax=Plantactinospora sp. KLBMP9567 TaxID=3085900 RepID=UPI0029821BAB|nr:carbamoyltransferase C-terminal domain-containing protein [Plantactinospora sp. KLBMP9567]MDW5324858.1 carbamoyltransferase C-terminal domain-containing protein [Plantactinospora sp. KLBMP9567]
MSGDRPSTGAVRTILSINFNHDGSAALLADGRLRAYVNTERFSRIKKHPGLRSADLDELLDQAGVTLADVDHVLLCNLHNMDSPDIAALHGSDLKDTWLEFWVNQDNSLVDIRGRRIRCTVNPDHHLIHAATAYFTAPFESGVALAIDPTGCRAFLGRGNRLYPMLSDFDSWFNTNVGYCDVANYLFGSSIVGAGKVMALAPYGRPDGVEPDVPEPERPRSFRQLLELAEKEPRYVSVQGRELNATLAYHIQAGLERQVSAVFRELAGLARRNGVEPAIALSGGTALNAIANQLAFAGSDLDRMHLHPACGDDGTAIGAALWYWHHVLDQPRAEYTAAELMYSAREYPAPVVRRALDEYADQIEVEQLGGYVDRAAALLTEGAVVGWFDGGGEVGPRALGHRSMLADPRDPGVQHRINSTVKFREHFRPFAPAVRDERSTEWFGIRDSPFMLRAAPVLRPGVPGITHVDGTARLQTVARSDNPAYYDLIHAFERRTGVPMLLNTSLNTRGEPMVETPGDALRTLLNSRLDYLVLPGYVVRRRAAG